MKCDFDGFILVVISRSVGNIVMWFFFCMVLWIKLFLEIYDVVYDMWIIIYIYCLKVRN